MRQTLLLLMTVTLLVSETKAFSFKRSRHDDHHRQAGRSGAEQLYRTNLVGQNNSWKNGFWRGWSDDARRRKQHEENETGKGDLGALVVITGCPTKG